jgi:hypothetical protein
MSGLAGDRACRVRAVPPSRRSGWGTCRLRPAGSGANCRSHLARVSGRLGFAMRPALRAFPVRRARPPRYELR